jgi:hypothetical protein
MVLTTSNKLILLMSALVINATSVLGLAPQYTISGLVQYGENIDRERLELLEDRQIIRVTDSHYLATNYLLTGTYTIRNRGDAYQATLGILFDEWQGGVPSPASTEIKFFVDGKEVRYTEIKTQNGVVMGESEIKFQQNSTAWALINVLFPENSVIKIKIQYINCFDPYGNGETSYFVYNSKSLSFFPELLYWKGPTKFSVEIINDYLSPNNVEYYWISNIQLYHDRNFNIINTNEYLLDIQRLKTDLLEIQKINENTFRIDFTEEFINNYNRSISIYFKTWTSERGAYIRYNYPNREIILTFLENNTNITQRELAQYELIFLTNNQLRIMRNAFYARHGYIFSSKEIRDMFDIFYYSNERRFYEPNPNFHEGMLTDIDRANIEIIRRLEALTAEN